MMKKTITLLLVMCLTIQMMCVSAFAETKQPITTTEVTIKDLETGEVKTYQLSGAKTIQGVDEDGNPIITSVFEIGDDTLGTTRSGQTNYNDFSGWRGTVTIDYTDDGTYACLKGAEASWTRRSGSATISNKSLNYGQDLGTNARNGSTGMSGSTVTIRTGWPAGKYGYNSGHKVGATLFATIDKKAVSVACNVSF